MTASLGSTRLCDKLPRAALSRPIISGAALNPNAWPPTQQAPRPAPRCPVRCSAEVRLSSPRSGRTRRPGHPPQIVFSQAARSFAPTSRTIVSLSTARSAFLMPPTATSSSAPLNSFLETVAIVLGKAHPSLSAQKQGAVMCGQKQSKPKAAKSST